jgi:hypothetical protein
MSRGSIFVAAVSIVLSALAQGADAATDMFSFTSSPQSWVGHGLSQTFTPAHGSTISASRYFDQGAFQNAIRFTLSDPEYGGYNLEMVGFDGAFPTVGTYPGATRWPFNGGNPGLDFSGNGRGNNTLTGNFTVKESVLDVSGNVLAFAADFTQYDEGNLNWWNTGSIYYHSSIPEPASAVTSLAVVGAFMMVRRRRGRVG